MIQLSGPVIFQGLQCLENIQLFLFEAKVVLISVANALPALWLRNWSQNDAESFLLHQSRYATDARFMKHIL